VLLGDRWFFKQHASAPISALIHAYSQPESAFWSALERDEAWLITQTIQFSAFSLNSKQQEIRLLYTIDQLRLHVWPIVTSNNCRAVVQTH
jgi:hypothetical protein